MVRVVSPWWMVTWAVVIGWPQPALAFQARMGRPVVQETLAPGEAATGTIELENQANEPVRLEVYLQDWEYVEGGSGDKLFSPPGSSPWSAASWISYFPKQLELPARGKGVVEYTVRVPADASGGRYAVLFFESVLARTKANEQGVTVQYTGRLGSLFEVDVAGTIRRAGEIAEVALGRPDEDRPLTLAYTFLNTGNVAARPKAYFNIVDASGRYFGRGEFPPLYTFPGRAGTATAQWTGRLDPGDYTVLLTVDVGTEEPLVIERPLAVKREVVVEAVTLHAGRRAEIILHNAGHVSTRCEGLLTVESATGVVEGSWPLEPVTLAPDERRQLVVSGPGSPSPGARCRVRLTVEDLTTEHTLPCRAGAR